MEVLMKKSLFWAAVAMALVSCSAREEMPAGSVPEEGRGYKVLTIQAECGGNPDIVRWRKNLRVERR